MSEIGLLEPFNKKDQWVVHCDCCNHRIEIDVRTLDNTTLENIAENTYFHYWNQELDFLNEMADLIRKHPTSNHWYKRKILGENRDLDKSEDTDPRFEESLAALLTRFKRDTNSSFNLKARTRAAHLSIAEQQEIVREHFFACPKCDRGKMFVDPFEFEA